MIFISLNMTLEEFLAIEKDKRMSQIDWMLFDRHIKDKSLSRKGDAMFGDNHGNLRAYIDRIFYYPFYYDKPLHIYLIKEKEYSKMNLFPEDFGPVACIWHMPRVPEVLKGENYPRIPQDEMLWGRCSYEETKEYLTKKFKELVAIKEDIAHICIGGD